MTYGNNNGGFETKEMRGSMFQNFKKKHPKAPDLTGKLKLNGKEYYISGWNQMSKGGKQYISLQLADPAEVQSRSQQSQPQATTQPTQPTQPIAPQQPVNNGFAQQPQAQNDGYVRANNDGIPY